MGRKLSMRTAAKNLVDAVIEGRASAIFLNGDKLTPEQIGDMARQLQDAWNSDPRVPRDAECVLGYLFNCDPAVMGGYCGMRVVVWPE